jgi:hypothetical protein
MKFISSLMSIGMPFGACSHSVKSLITRGKPRVFANNLYQINERFIVSSFIGLKEGNFNGVGFISSARVI